MCADEGNSNMWGGYERNSNIWTIKNQFETKRNSDKATMSPQGEFPEGTIFFKELQLTLPAKNPDGSRTEPSGRGYFPGKFNGADVTVKDTKRYADTGGWGYYKFNHHEPKAPTAKLQPKSECAYCHMASAKKDDVWTQFYPLLDN
jgi:hypothetical protein